MSAIDRYAIADWPRTAERLWSEVAAVATDAADRVYVFARDPHRVLVFDRDGQLLKTWGEGLFVRPHGIAIGPDGAIWCTDDLDHTIRKYSTEGELLLKLGESGRPSNTGATSVDFRTIRAAGEPFHYPTNLAFSPSGEIYVADGYGNARVHKFTADGGLLFSWGELGSGPGQFHIPHGIAIDREGRVFVADRENSRLQIFSPDGKFLDQWTGIARPCQVTFGAAGNVLVAELGYRAGMWPGTSPPSPDATGGRVSIFTPRGELLSRWGGGEHPTAPGDFYAPHDICVDSHGDIYVAEVVWSAGGKRGVVPPTCHALQKFAHPS
jgi:DNA-binding beta-propeller fold protein YncE